jgi:L-2-hydroxyglutarate oxidase LhgO
LHADKVSSLVGINDKSYELSYCKGEYFSIGNRKNSLVKRLIYPVPEKNLKGLGVHTTIDINGGLKLGPNAYYLKNNYIDYTVDINNKLSFYNSAKKFLPFLEIDDLNPAYSGIRPKLQKENESFRDFIIKEESDKGYSNFYNLIGIESPGLTSCLSIAKYIKKIIK